MADATPGGFEGPDAERRAPASERAVADRRHLARQWDELVERVRRLDGFEHFLEAIPFAELRAAAGTGAIAIVNVSRLGCDALIVAASGDPGVRRVPLPGLTYQETVDEADTLLGVLERAGQSGLPFLVRETDRRTVFDVLDWLWQVVAAPVLDALSHTALPDGDEALPCVWWCPTGPLTLLPLHAAGHYSRTNNEPTRREVTVHGRVVSSYTPTLAGLRRAREAPAAAPDEVRQLVVGMPTTPGQQPLPAAPGELAVLAEYLPPPRQARQLVAEEATVPAVERMLADFPWVHLACHARQDQAHPADSAFALWDGPLTLASLTTLPTGHAELAFLSACQTATGTIKLLDEAIYLAAAMQLLGYRHVVATSWAIADAPTPEVARAFYGWLTRGGRPDASQAATALHHAVWALQESCPGEPLLWAPYVHIGP